MVIDKVISAALGLAAAHTGGNACLSRRISDDLGTTIHGATLGKYRNGEIEHINDPNWEILYPYLRPYLPDHPRYWPRTRLAGGPLPTASETCDTLADPLATYGSAVPPHPASVEPGDIVFAACPESDTRFLLRVLRVLRPPPGTASEKGLSPCSP